MDKKIVERSEEELEEFISANWLLLYRLTATFGYDPDEAVDIAKKIVSGEILMADVAIKEKTK